MARDWLRLPVVSAGAEFLVMGYLMRRNILAYKAPPNNEGYDLICIHPNPRHEPGKNERAQLRIQVKSRYATNCGQTFPVKKQTLNAFDFLIGVFLNIGNFGGKHDGSTGCRDVDLYTFPRELVPDLYDPKSGWDKVAIRKFNGDLAKHKNDAALS